jgi:hypothetical protein
MHAYTSLSLHRRCLPILYVGSPIRATCFGLFALERRGSRRLCGTRAFGWLSRRTALRPRRRAARHRPAPALARDRQPGTPPRGAAVRSHQPQRRADRRRPEAAGWGPRDARGPRPGGPPHPADRSGPDAARGHPRGQDLAAASPDAYGRTKDPAPVEVAFTRDPPPHPPSLPHRGCGLDRAVA